ncbi:MAG: acetyl-CoA acetyltransferase [Alphaproteobacteria bacterium]|nr:acetyl-CoA acetyltransferase [Alphaproteobacteria bacterium]MBU1512498.1 acetyl-CoA acetyltransferase [Alphaproteobacteria bacterium]MBU2096578.1 acetyl-CoA acetyltransferase [Alphaproteobacteria bacterium]MBU2151604.1 acetyl-CoA acetyltransferase [Alphaproteobacteria bacterium]MBU2307322.1 acetyl-CoA acetyltransferase [Alphaproteobacteria bacterium]
MAIFLLGGHQTDFARAWSREGLDLTDMMGEAIAGALAACKLDHADIDAIHVGNAFGELYRGQGHLAAMVAQVTPEFYGKPAMRHEAACASSSIAVLAATAEIEAGRYDCVMIVGVEEEKNLPGDEASKVQNAASWQGREDIDCRFMWPAVFGRVAQEYGERYGLDRRHLNRIAEINLGNAKRNPNAQTRKWQFGPDAFTDDDTANPIIEPGTRRQDCGQITDGATAIVLCSERFMEAYARRRGADAAAFPQILGWGHANAGIRFLDKIERSRGETYVFPHVRKAVTDAFRRAGVSGPEALDGIETHDCFTSTEYMAIDHFGLTEPGQSWKAVEEGVIELGGRCPVNASGGLIGVGHPVGATGARMLLDAGRQVTGTAGDYQVDGAHTYGTLNIGGSLGTVVSFVVGRPA